MKPVDTMWKKDLQTEVSESRERILRLESELSEVKSKYEGLSHALKAGIFYVVLRWKHIRSLL